MTVSVTLLARMRKYASDRIGKDGAVTLPDGATVRDLLDRLALPGGRGTVVLVDGSRRSEKDTLASGSDVKILSMAGGG